MIRYSGRVRSVTVKRVQLRRGRRVGGGCDGHDGACGPAPARVLAGSRAGRTSVADLGPQFSRSVPVVRCQLFGAWLAWLPAGGAPPGAFLPVGVIAYQVPPAPWPLVSPGAVSPANRYTGQPAMVTWRSKSGRT